MNPDIHDRLTDALIDENRIQVRLQRRKKQTVAGGGWKWVPDRTLPIQDCRLIYRANASDSTRRTLPGGRIVHLEAVLVFTLEGDVQVPDVFELNGETWEVATVRRGYDIAAEVFRHAG